MTYFFNHVNVHSYDDINACRKFGNILLIPGMGFMEIITTKAIFKVLWNIMLKDLAVMLEWKSIKALTVCEKKLQTTTMLGKFYKFFLILVPELSLNLTYVNV